MPFRSSAAGAATLRALAPTDLSAAGALLAADHSVGHYLARAAEAVRGAADGRGEHQCLVAGCGGALYGLVLFGDVPGSDGAAAVTAVSVLVAQRRRGIGSALLRAACDALGARGARLVVAEMPDDPSLDAARALFVRNEFEESGRVPDLFGAGVDLLLFERRLVR